MDTAEESALDNADLVHWSPKRGPSVQFLGGSLPTLSGTPMGSIALVAGAAGALALGAIAIGALAIGSLAIGRARFRSVRIGRLVVDELIVRQAPRL